MIIEYRIINLVEFECGNCFAKWVVQDFDFKVQSFVTCPKCAICSEINNEYE